MYVLLTAAFWQTAGMLRKLKVDMPVLNAV
jgi:hypothetical protein